MGFERAGLRLDTRQPFDGARLVAFLAARAVSGVEEWDGRVYRRSLRLAHGLGVAELAPEEAGVRATFHLAEARNLDEAVERCRRLFDLDADPTAIADRLGGDPFIGALVRARPGLRVPGSVDPAEIAIRAVLGQQISVSGARTMAGRIAACLASRWSSLSWALPGCSPLRPRYWRPTPPTFHFPAHAGWR